ncbi:efflux RND transporter permease subunit [candidate division KSB1 bacterium]|nr:efflux RND transporter permease subunit [candidate division KSB1 bacterium]
MTIAQMAVKRGITFSMIYLIAVGFGLFSLSQLDIDLYPDIEFPIIAVITQYTGVAPYDIETVLSRPVEESVASAENVKHIYSTSFQGLSMVLLEFDWGTDMDQAEFDVRNSLELIRDFLPDDASDPMVFAFNPSMQPVIYLALESKIHGEAEIRRIAEQDLEPRIERIPGVAAAFTVGGIRREIKVLVDPAKLQAHHIPIEQVSRALQMNNLQLPAGYIDNESMEFTLQAAGEFTTLEQIENTNVATIQGTNIHVKDVATVVDGFQEARNRVWNNSKPAIMVMVQKQSDANTVNVCKHVKDRLKQIESELPKGVAISISFDQSDFINRAMSNLGNTAIQAILLTFLVLLFFLQNIRSSLIVAVSIPVSMITTFAVMYQSGLSLNVISMAGLALAVGMLVDNSIVVLESIFRYRESGDSPYDAAVKGVKEVSMAITASTLTTVAVFLPVLFVPGIAGELFKDMVITICFSLGISLIVAITLIPLLSSRVFKASRTSESHGRIHKFSEKVDKWLGGVNKFYDRSLRWSLDHRKTLIFTTFLLFALSVTLLVIRGGEFIPKNDNGYIILKVKRTPGISLEAMEKSMAQLNQIVKDNIPEADNIYVTFGQAEGFTALFSSATTNEGQMMIRLVKGSKRNRSKFQIQDDMLKKFNNLVDMDISFDDQGGAMLGSGGDIVVKIFGHDLAQSKILANTVRDKVLTIEGITHAESSIRESRPELKINYDRQRIADLGMSTVQIGNVVSTCILGSAVTRYREGGDEYDVRVQLEKDARTSKDDIGNILVMTPMGRQIPLRAVADIDYSQSFTEIKREDQERIASVNISISGRNLRAITADVEKMMHQISMPNGFRFEIGGAAEDMQESFMYLGLALFVAIFLTYMIMASQFESLFDPFIILFTIPLSFIGVAFALLITDTDLSVMALIGVVMLVGIVVNNGIVLIDYINQLRDKGMGLFEAVIEGGRVRLRPVLMTALTTILGMLPMALGLGESGESWAPLARVVMGGLTVSTALTLVVVPVMYTVMELLAARIHKWRTERAARRGVSPIIPEQV